MKNKNPKNLELKALTHEFNQVENMLSSHNYFYYSLKYTQLPQNQQMLYKAEDSFLYRYLDMLAFQSRYAAGSKLSDASFNSFDFSTALILLRRGAYVTRCSWNDDDWYQRFVLKENADEKLSPVRKYLMYCSLDNITERIDNSIIPILFDTIDCYKRFVKELRQKGENIMEQKIYSVEFDEITEENESVLWKPNDEDILANDWYLINDSSKCVNKKSEKTVDMNKLLRNFKNTFGFSKKDDVMYIKQYQKLCIDGTLTDLTGQGFLCSCETGETNICIEPSEAILWGKDGYPFPDYPFEYVIWYNK